MLHHTNRVVLTLTLFVLLLTGIMSLSNGMFAPRTRVNTITPQEKQNRDFVRSLVKKTGGDYSKLTPKDNEELNKRTRGFGKTAFDEVNQNG